MLCFAGLGNAVSIEIANNFVVLLFLFFGKYSMDVAYSPTGKEFVSGSYDRTIRIFDARQTKSREVYHTKRMQRLVNSSIKKKKQ